MQEKLHGLFNKCLGTSMGYGLSRIGSSVKGNEIMSIEGVDIMAKEVPESQRWAGERRSTHVFSIPRDKFSVQEAARRHGLKVAEIQEWKDRFLFRIENALLSGRRGEDAFNNQQHKKVGELGLDIDITKAGRGRPFSEKNVNDLDVEFAALLKETTRQGISEGC